MIVCMIVCMTVCMIVLYCIVLYCFVLNRIQQSAKGNCAYIFKHLRNKQQDEPTNLVMDKDHNIIVAPQQAISSLNETWDDVYAVNVLRDHPLQMLHTVWPYIQHTYPLKFPQPTWVTKRASIL